MEKRTGASRATSGAGASTSTVTVTIMHTGTGSARTIVGSNFHSRMARRQAFAITVAGAGERPRFT